MLGCIILRLPECVRSWISWMPGRSIVGPTEGQLVAVLRGGRFFGMIRFVGPIVAGSWWCRGCTMGWCVHPVGMSCRWRKALLERSLLEWYARAHRCLAGPVQQKFVGLQFSLHYPILISRNRNGVERSLPRPSSNGRVFGCLSPPRRGRRCCLQGGEDFPTCDVVQCAQDPGGVLRKRKGF